MTSDKVFQYNRCMFQKEKLLSFLKQLVIILFIPSILLNIFLGYQNLNQKKQNLVKVIGVIDGDTIVLENKTRLRLRHVDAPELVNCGGEQAKQFVLALVNGKSITIEEEIPDQMGRAMALIYLDKILVNEKLLEAGWARYHSDKTTKTLLLKKVADEAKTNKLGIFSTLCLSDTNLEKPNCIIKGNFENKSASERKLYYLPNCAQYKFVLVEKDLGEQWFCTEKEATAAGYIKAGTCK
jgi:endonuclease YncB( thermonuclease family)